MKKKIKRLKIGGTGICSRDHAGEMPDEALAAIEDLPFSQAGPGRHCCAVCAYLLGVQHGEEKAIRKAAELMEIMKGVKS